MNACLIRSKQGKQGWVQDPAYEVDGTTEGNRNFLHPCQQLSQSYDCTTGLAERAQGCPRWQSKAALKCLAFFFPGWFIDLCLIKGHTGKCVSYLAVYHPPSRWASFSGTEGYKASIVNINIMLDQWYSYWTSLDLVKTDSRNTRYRTFWKDWSCRPSKVSHFRLPSRYWLRARRLSALIVFWEPGKDWANSQTNMLFLGLPPSLSGAVTWRRHLRLSSISTVHDEAGNVGEKAKESKQRWNQGKRQRKRRIREMRARRKPGKEEEGDRLGQKRQTKAMQVV